MDAIKNACLQKWSDGQELDERLTKFNTDFECWIEQIPEKNRETVLTLIQHMEYYSHKNVNKWLENLHQKLLSVSSVNDENTIYVFIKSEWGKTNSSNDYWTEYKALNHLNPNICIENITALDDDDFGYIENIIYIDDFCGSGGSFLKEIKRYPERLKGKNVYYITINMMLSAIDEIENYCTAYNIGIVFLSACSQEKAFCRHLFTDDESAKKEIVEMSDSLLIKRFVLGYKGSQSLVAFYNNTPNNSLGFIHVDTPNYKSIFPRSMDTIPTWMKLKKQRKRQKNTNLNNKKNGV